MGKIVIVGITNFSRELKQWAEDCGLTVEAFIEPMSKIEILDDTKVLRNFDKLKSTHFLIGETQSPRIREMLTNMAIAHGLQPYPGLIHPTSVISNGVVIEKGSIVCPNTVISPYSKISEGAVVLYGKYVPVDTVVNKFEVV